MKKLTTKELFKSRWKIRKYIRRKPNGCLEYVGPPRGGSVGNPVISVKTGKRKNKTVHLRTWVYEQYHGPIPKGMYPRMQCGNFRCMEHRHVRLQRGFSSYRPKKNEYIVRLSRVAIRNILYYKGRVPSTVLGSVTRLPPQSIWLIWRGKSYSSMTPEPHWHPNAAFETQVENACLTNKTIYLGTRSMEIAINDVLRSSLAQNQKNLVLRLIAGEPSTHVSLSLGKSFAGVLFLYRRALSVINQQIGNKRWIRLASENRILPWIK